MDSIYEDIARRTDGDIYIGVVGPVRTGKSTFIKRFMEMMVIPNIENVYRKERTRDELPQSGSGRTVMTAEPKFVPEEAAQITLDMGQAHVRLIDCVGYMIPGAEGLYEDGQERMVSTPWFEEAIPLSQAAEEGTKRVIAEHSTIGLVITTDGSFGDISRESYVEAEQRSIRELQEIGKPFVIVLNSAQPEAEETIAIAKDINKTYNVPCMPVNCQSMSISDIGNVMEAILYQFPLSELSIRLPAWADALPLDSPLKQALFAEILNIGQTMLTMEDAKAGMIRLSESEYISGAEIVSVHAGTGTASASVTLKSELYYNSISQQSGFEIRDDRDLMELLQSMHSLKTEYDHVHDALEQVRTTGYGVIMPRPEEMTLEQPQIVSRGGRYSVRMKATAPAIHMFRTQVETEVTPAVGGEGASEDIVSFLLQGFDGDVNKIWDSNIFGKSLNDIAEEGLTAKILRMSPNIRNRLRITAQKAVNEGGYGLICIII